MRSASSPGVAFPSASNHEHIFIVRFDISDSTIGNQHRNKEIIRNGPRGLCRILDDITIGEKKIEVLTDDGDIKLMALLNLIFLRQLGLGQVSSES